MTVVTVSTPFKHDAVSAVMKVSCPGSCCERFHLSSGPDHLREIIAAQEQRQAEGRPVAEDILRDNRYILDMVIPLDDGSGLYTCRHWDPETRLCTAYEQRPWMCRAYPYGRHCEYGCTYNGRNVGVPARRFNERERILNGALAEFDSIISTLTRIGKSSATVEGSEWPEFCKRRIKEVRKTRREVNSVLIGLRKEDPLPLVPVAGGNALRAPATLPHTKRRMETVRKP